MFCLWILLLCINNVVLLYLWCVCNADIIYIYKFWAAGRSVLFGFVEVFFLSFFFTTGDKINSPHEYLVGVLYPKYVLCFVRILVVLFGCCITNGIFIHIYRMYVWLSHHAEWSMVSQMDETCNMIWWTYAIFFLKKCYDQTFGIICTEAARGYI